MYCLNGGYDFGRFFSDLCTNKGNASNPNPFTNFPSSSGTNFYEDDVEESNDPYKEKYDNLLEEFSQYRKRVQNTLETEKRLLKRNLMKGFLNDFVVFLVNTYKGKKTIGNTMTEEDYLILKKMNDFLDSMNIVPMEDPTGKPFDYNTMEAVYSDHNADNDIPKGHVSKVIYNGFTMDGEVLLPQRVAVVAD